MPLFKKKNKNKDVPEKKDLKTNPPDFNKKTNETPEGKKVKVVKRKKVGFRHKKERKEEKQIKQETKNVEPEIDDFVEEFESIEEEMPTTETNEEIERKKPFSTKKKKTIIKGDMKNKPVYLEDTGEKLGIVYDSIYDKDKNLVGYKIKDGKSNSVLSFPLDQFDLSKDGLIFVPGWYTNALRLIEKLEFKDKISPDLTALLSDDAVSNEELYEIFVKHDDEMVNYIDDAKSLREMLTSRLKVLEKQRLALKDDLMDLTEKRLIKDIDRRQFSEDVMDHRRKVNILDLNITKCKDLVKRLDVTSFGVLGKNAMLTDETKSEGKIEKNLYKKILETGFNNNDPGVTQNLAKKDDGYKDKYFELKNQYSKLEEDYQELKIAVDRLLENKD